MSSLSRIKPNSFSRLTGNLKPSVPEKLKGGRLEKIGKYFYNIFNDYRVVFHEILQDSRDRPLKAAFYGSLIATGVIMIKTNPSEQSFNAEIIGSSNMLSTVGEPIRNSRSDNHITMLTVAMKDGRLKVRNLRFFSLVFVNEFPSYSGLFEANCPQVKPHWTEWYKLVVDVGIFGKWLYLKDAMKDYDVNPDEWLPNGRPKKSNQLLPAN